MVSDRKLLQRIEQAARNMEVRLDLSGNGLTRIPDEISQLPQLQQLDLGNNNLTTLPKALTKLIYLEKLSLSKNKLTEIPQEISQLPQLRVLDLSNNNLTFPAPELARLTQIHWLYLNGNNLTIFPEEITRLAQLRVLNLSDNKLTDLPAEISLLTQLQQFYLNGNLLTTLPKEIAQLTQLQVLNLNGNNLTSLPDEIHRLAHRLQAIFLRDNRLQISPEVLETEDPQQIITHYFQSKAARKPLNEAKLLVMGSSGVGKTSLVRRLTEDRFSLTEAKTEGINIKRWLITSNSTQIKLNVWDFAGQERMQTMHQFFMTQRGLYLLVLDAQRGEQENRIEHWLKIIQAFGGASPIIIVCNKGEEQEIDLNWAGIRRKYPNVKAFINKVSCQTGEGIATLRSTIESEVNQLQHIHDLLPFSWLDIRNTLENMEDDYIPYQEYQEICESRYITSSEDRYALIRLLHDLGVVLNSHNANRAEDTHIVNPAKITQAVYRIINAGPIHQNRGIFHIDQLSDILDPQIYRRDQHLALMNVICQFGYCASHKTDEAHRFLLPDLSGKGEPETGDWSGSIIFQYYYETLPGSVICRFIAQMSPFMSSGMCWQTGVVLEYQNSSALVRADLEAHKIQIYLRGPQQTRSTLLQIIRSHFDEIHATIPKIDFREVVKFPEHPTIEIDYQGLVNFSKMGIDTYRDPKTGTEFNNIDQLLEGIRSDRPLRKHGRTTESRKTSDIQRKENDQKSHKRSSIATPWTSWWLYFVLFIAVVAILGVASFYTELHDFLSQFLAPVTDVD